MDLDEAEWLNQDRTYIEASNIEEENSKPLVPVLFLSDHNYGTVTQGSVVQVKLKVDSPEYSNSYIKHKRKKIKKPHYSIRSHIENWAKEDEFDIYGKYIASQLRKIELQRALEVQFQIQNLINKARASED